MKRESWFKNYGVLAMGLWMTLILLLFGSNPARTENIRGVTDDIIKFGLIADMTGPNANTGIQASSLFRTYFRHLNDQGGVNGRKIKLIIEDDRYSIPGSLAAFKKMIYRDGVLAINGPSGTGQSQAMLHLFEEEKVTNIPWSNDASMHTPFKKFVFPSPGDYRDQMYVIFDYIMKDLGAKNPRIFIVYPDVGFGKVALEYAKERAMFYGVKLAGAEILNFGSLDATSQVLNLKRKRPDYLIMQQNETNTTALLRDANKYRLEIPSFGLMYCCIHDVVRMAGDAAKNLICADAYDHWHMDTHGMRKLRKITMKYNPGTEDQYRSKMFIRFYNDAIVLVEGMKKAGKDLNNITLVNALETLRDFDSGVSGLVTYTSDNHKATNFSRLFKVDLKKKVFAPLTDWRKPIVSR